MTGLTGSPAFSECAAVVVVNRKTREISTRFDKHVRFQPSPVTFRISPNAGSEILNRNNQRNANDGDLPCGVSPSERKSYENL